MQFKLLKFSLRSICKDWKRGILPLFLLFFIASPLIANGIQFTHIYPDDLVINIHPDNPSGKAEVFWNSPASGKYTLQYNYNGEKTALKDISCNSGDTVKFYITSNSITTSTGEKSILDLPDGTYPFTITLSAGTTYSAQFTITVDGTPPHTPTGLRGIPGDSSVKLAWDAPPPEDNDIENYFIYYSSSPGIVSRLSKENNNITTLKTPGNINTYIVDHLKNNTTYHFVLRAKDRADNYSGYSAETTVTPRTTYTLSDLTGEEGGCFIATAAFGNLDNPFVISFRLFRDFILKKFPGGLKLIKFYYRYSPPYAHFIAKSPLLRITVLILLIPLSFLVSIVTLFTFYPSLLLTAGIALYSLFLKEE